jgi:hypothetical protein
VLIDRHTREILCLFFGKGARHDFHLFKASEVKVHPQSESLQDSGYQGIKSYHANSYVPRKKPKGGALSKREREYNRRLGQERVGIEHVNRRLKIFKILAGQYRNRRHRFKLRFTIIAVLYNHELSLTASGIKGKGASGSTS